MNKVLVTGGAGFIGSNLIGKLIDEGFNIICLDNLSTGKYGNIEEFDGRPNFQFYEGDILDFDLIIKLSKEVDTIFHQAALGSVPRSIDDPLTSNRVNVEGTLNIFKAAVDNKIEKVIYAASSSTYGDLKSLPKVEDKIGKPLSPYAVTKYVNELYADVFYKVYGLKTIGLRYFNVFGPKQNPGGPYAAVIPLFIQSILSKVSPTINGDGDHSRDFTYVDNVVSANIRAMLAPEDANNKVYNIAAGKQTSLNELFQILLEISKTDLKADYGPERQGDVKHSLADISRARSFLKYEPMVDVKIGLEKTYLWYQDN